MLQAHSILWNYLWLAPNMLLAVLGIALWLRDLHRRMPVFCIFALLISTEQLVVYAADVSPWVSAQNFWRVFWVSLLIEGFLKIALIADLFGGLLGSYSSIAGLGRASIRAVGVVLTLAAVVAAAYAQKENAQWLIGGAHLLEQTIYLIECGLLVFIFLFAAHFRLAWSHTGFGIALGLGISACVHLGTWAIMANGGLPERRHFLDLLNMAAYHACVLIWFYYLLVPEKRAAKMEAALPENNLDVWNRELERLLQS